MNKIFLLWLLFQWLRFNLVFIPYWFSLINFIYNMCKYLFVSLPHMNVTSLPAHRPLMVNGNDFRTWRPFKPHTAGLWTVRDCSPLFPALHSSPLPHDRNWSPPRCGRDTTRWLSCESPHDMSVTHSPLLHSRSVERFNKLKEINLSPREGK